MRPDEELPRDFRFMPGDRTEETMWSRFSKKFILTEGYTKWDKIGVFGHTPVSYYGKDDVVKLGNIRLIDTGVADFDKMTAYCCETDEWISERVVDQDKDPNAE